MCHGQLYSYYKHKLHEQLFKERYWTGIFVLLAYLVNAGILDQQ